MKTMQEIEQMAWPQVPAAFEIEIRDLRGNLLARGPSVENCLAQLVGLVSRYRAIVQGLHTEIDQLKEMPS